MFRRWHEETLHNGSEMRSVQRMDSVVIDSQQDCEKRLIINITYKTHLKFWEKNLAAHCLILHST